MDDGKVEINLLLNFKENRFRIKSCSSVFSVQREKHSTCYFIDWNTMDWTEIDDLFIRKHDDSILSFLEERIFLVIYEKIQGKNG